MVGSVKRHCAKVPRCRSETGKFELCETDQRKFRFHRPRIENYSTSTDEKSATSRSTFDMLPNIIFKLVHCAFSNARIQDQYITPNKPLIYIMMMQRGNTEFESCAELL
jgi:hypothetical protein